ncbi:hypothetical protein GA707_06265 [Nostocoides sp. F2B08]|uniref:DUF6049 family protein n=1 Tax=Nostocoides sp. F2B08 TaxID=2653936 RepID=UPI001263A323|nr:DUF6049 family protein [Tetrasphaera sp. F2B08]KAB7745519.1 hypothetical protein GA707_06265 [Tetrasphaera sp. F2B08]
MARARAAATPLALALTLLLLLAVLVSGFPSASASYGASASHPASAPLAISAPASSALPAADEEQTSGVGLTGVDPLVATPGRPVTVSGTLDVARLGLDLSEAPGEPSDAATPPTSPSPTTPGSTSADPPASEPPVATVEVRLGGQIPRTSEEVDAWLTAPGPSGGTLIASSPVAAGTDPGAESIPFDVTIDDVEEWVSDAYGILPVSLEVVTAGDSEPAGVLRTYVPYEVRKEYEPLQVMLVVPVTVPLDLALLGEFGDERTAAWESLVGENGTLRQVLAAADDPSIAWAVDPALLEPGPAPAEVPDDEEEDQGAESQGPAVTTQPTTAPGTSGPSPTSPTVSGAPGGTPTPPTDTATDDGTDEQDLEEPPPGVREHTLRAEFAADLVEGVDGRTVLLLPQHDADIGALADDTTDDSTPEAVRDLLTPPLDVAAARETLEGAGAEVAPTVWPAAGAWSTSLDAAFAELLSSAAAGGAEDAAAATGTPWMVMPSSDSLTQSTRGPFSSPAGIPVTPYDATLSRAAGSAHDESSTVTAGLAMTAHSLIELNELPGTTRHRIVVLERDSASTGAAGDLDAVVDAVPWLEPAGLGDAGRRGALVEVTPPAETAVLDDDRARNLLTTVGRLPVAASVRADDGSDLATRGADVLDQLVSLRWRGAPEDWTTAYQPIGTTVSETFEGLTIPSRDISFLADSGLLRVTVENSLDTGIENAVLDLTVEDPILRVESGPQPVEVGADSRTTVGFDAVAIASGRVDVTATLRAPDGTILSEPTAFSVRVSPTSDWIYWVLGALAGLVLVIGVVRTVTRRRPSA